MEEKEILSTNEENATATTTNDEVTKNFAADLKESAKLKIAVIGSGNAGGQGAAAAYKAGFSVFVINSSIQDLSEEVLQSEIPSYAVGNSRGCGKDRMIAKKFMSEGTVALFENKEFADIVDPADIIILNTSASGGWGSGSTPFLASKIRKVYPNKLILTFAYTPKAAEYGISQYNTLEFADEMDQLKLPYNFIDLEQLNDTSDADCYKAAIADFIEKINIVRGDYFLPTVSDSIDETDTLTLFSPGGYFAMGYIKGITEEVENFQDLLIANLKNGPNAPIEKNKVITNMGVCFNIPKSLKDSVTHNYSKLIDTFGVPMRPFTHDATIEGADGMIAIILTGLSMPYTRMNVCKAIVEKTAANKKESNVSLTKDKEKYAETMRSDTATRDKITGSSSAKMSIKDAMSSEEEDIFK